MQPDGGAMRVGGQKQVPANKRQLWLGATAIADGLHPIVRQNSIRGQGKKKDPQPAHRESRTAGWVDVASLALFSSREGHEQMHSLCNCRCFGGRGSGVDGERPIAVLTFFEERERINNNQICCTRQLAAMEVVFERKDMVDL